MKRRLLDALTLLLAVVVKQAEGIASQQHTRVASCL